MSVSLCVDVGNTRVKAAWFNERLLLKNFSIERENFLEKGQELWELPVDRIILSSVSDHESLLSLLKKLSKRILLLDHHSKIPIKNLYKNPESLGKDRLAAVIGGRAIFPGKDLLTIDAGTCITMDFLNKEGEYHGGCISPGIQMRLKAMHTYTSKLPNLSWEPPVLPDLIGNSTTASIRRSKAESLFYVT